MCPYLSSSERQAQECGDRDEEGNPYIYIYIYILYIYIVYIYIYIYIYTHMDNMSCYYMKYAYKTQEIRQFTIKKSTKRTTHATL